MRKVIARDPATHLSYTAWFHGFDSTEDSVYAIVEDDSTGVIEGAQDARRPRRS
jgi:hypothetical protein